MLRRCRLTEDEAIGIFQCKGGPSNATKTARAFCVSEKTVRDIWTGRTWAKETSHLDASRAIKVTQMGRPKGRRDSHPRKSRRVNISSTGYAVSALVTARVAMHHPGSDGLRGKGDCVCMAKDHEIPRTAKPDGRGSLDAQLLTWEQQPIESPAFHDPFRQDLAVLLSYLNQSRPDI